MGTVSRQLRPHSPSRSYRRTTGNGDGESSGARAAGLEQAEGAPKEAPAVAPGAAPASARSPSRRPRGCNHLRRKFHSPGAVRRAQFLANDAGPSRAAGLEDAPAGASPPCGGGGEHPAALHRWSPPHRRFPPSQRRVHRQLRLAGLPRSRAFLAPLPPSLAVHFRRGGPADRPDCPSHARRRGGGLPAPDPGQWRPLSGGHRPPAPSTGYRPVHRAGRKDQRRCRSLRVEDAQASTPGSASCAGGTCAATAGSDRPLCAWTWSGGEETPMDSSSKEHGEEW